MKTIALTALKGLDNLNGGNAFHLLRLRLNKHRVPWNVPQQEFYD